jgi:hypothetical protein
MRREGWLQNNTDDSLLGNETEAVWKGPAKDYTPNLALAVEVAAWRRVGGREVCKASIKNRSRRLRSFGQRRSS